jgi:glucosylceramidase
LFVRNHLGPLFKSLNLDCQIYLGTFPRSDAKKYDYSYWLGTALRDPLTRSFVTGVGCQWGGDGVMRDAGRKNPGIKLMQTEAECGETNTNDWDFAHRRFDDIVKFLNCGAESFMIWNMVLDETGESTAGWDQCSPIVIDQVDQPGVQVRYTPYYYAFKHFSSFVVPGSVRVDAASSGPACEAFIAPGGQVVVVTENAKPYPQALHLAVSGHHFSATLPALSFNSFVLDATAAGK